MKNSLQEYIDDLPLDSRQRRKLEQLIDEDRQKQHSTDVKDWRSAATKKG